MPQTQKNLDPPSLRIWLDLMTFAWRGLALAAAVELDLFSRIADGNLTAEMIAAAAGTAEDATRRLLDALVGLGYLKRSSQQYRLTSGAAEYLVRGKPLYMGESATLGKMLAGTWSMLPEVVRSGRPLNQQASPQDAQEFFARLVPALFANNFNAASAAVARLTPKEKAGIKRILDIGAGAAAWSIPFARALRKTRVTVVDYPAVARVTREYAERWGVGDRYDYLEGDFNRVEFGAGFDLAILGHILHGGATEWARGLLRRCAAALNPGGMLLIGEFVPNDERTGPELALLFGLNMLINTQDGDVYTMREYREWLKQAGFRKVATIEAPHVSPLILATK
ncbi:MAG TPA: methyltransferase [Candidatus Binataceae bacterium]|nr:methyltransferase [Candidatus Binataceae bacterium]